jgi:hypothetical protein
MPGRCLVLEQSDRPTMAQAAAPVGVTNARRPRRRWLGKNQSAAEHDRRDHRPEDGGDPSRHS